MTWYWTRRLFRLSCARFLLWIIVGCYFFTGKLNIDITCPFTSVINISIHQSSPVLVTNDLGLYAYCLLNPKMIQATGLDAWASRVKCPARFVSHLHDICIYIWVVYSFCLFCWLFIIVTTQFVALYEPCKPKPKPSTYYPDPPPPPPSRTTTPWQRSKFRYLDRSQSNKYVINMQIQTISVSK